MVRKHTLYQFTTLGWWVASIGALVLVMTGQAEPYVSPGAVPYGGPGAFGITAVAVITGTAVIARLEIRSWKKMGRRAGLEPEESSLLGKPDLAGVVDGRTVRAFTYKVTKGGGGEGGGSTTTYTVVEAELREPEQNGYIIGRGEAQEADVDVPDELRQKDIDGEYYLIGDASAEYGRTVLTGRVRNAFDRPGGPRGVVVGDPTEAILAAIPDEVGGLLGSMVTSGIESKLEDKRSFKAAMASHNMRGLLLDADELDAQIEAVLAVAEAHEAASARTPRA